MLLIPFLFLSNLSFSQETNYSVGGSFNKKGSSSEFISGALSMVDRVVDSYIPLYPKAIFYNNDGKFELDASATRNLIFKEKVDLLFGFSEREGIKESSELAKSADVPFAFPQISFNRQDSLDFNIVGIRPTIEEDLEIISSFLNDSEYKKILFIVDENSKWEADYISNLITDKEIEISIYVKEPMNLNNSILKVFRTSPELIVVLGEKEGSLSFLKRVSFSKLRSIPKLIPFYLTSSDTKKHVKKYKNNILAVRILPNLDSDHELVKDYIRDSRKYMPRETIGESGFEGYVSMYIAMLRASKISFNDDKNIFTKRSQEQEANIAKSNIDLLLEGESADSSNSKVINELTSSKKNTSLDKALPLEDVIANAERNLINLRVEQYFEIPSDDLI